MSDVLSDLKNWSATPSNNLPSGTTVIGSGLDDNLRQIQATVKQDLATVGADIASASTTDLGAVAGSSHKITGSSTITSFGSVVAGITKRLVFAAGLQITYNATTMLTPGAVNMTITAGDTIMAESLGAGNWRIYTHYTATETRTGITTGTLSVTGNETVGGTLGVTGVLTASGGVTGNVTGNVTGSCTGNAATATTATNLSGGTVNAVGGIRRNSVLVISDTIPTLGAGWGTNPSIIATANGSIAFSIFVGTGGAANFGVVNMPTAPNFWIAHVSVGARAANQAFNVIPSNNSFQINSINITTAVGLAFISGQQLDIIAIPY